MGKSQLLPTIYVLSRADGVSQRPLGFWSLFGNGQPRERVFRETPQAHFWELGGGGGAEGRSQMSFEGRRSPLRVSWLMVNNAVAFRPR